MKFRNIVMVFLEYEGRILLMKRGLHKAIGPGAWAGIAGHIKGEEINRPYDACYREIQEETGLAKKDIDQLALKYIIYNRLEEETVVNHIFYGRTKTDQVKANDEGELFWIPKDEVAEKMAIPAVRMACENCLTESAESDGSEEVGSANEVRLAVAIKEEPYLMWLLL